MKKQKQGRLLCALCLALLLIPLAGMLLAGPSDAVSNERLAAKPRLMRGGKLNPDFLSETADYFAGHFYLRPALLTANSTVQAAVFRNPRLRTWCWETAAGFFTRTRWRIFRGRTP